jgi:biopolymer transport protein TolR
MAAALQKTSRGYSRRRPPMAEINVTPFVDVMLVLLIVFMVTAPLMTVGVTVDLPKASAPNVKGSDEPIAVSVDAKGQVYLMETAVELDDLAARLTAIAKNDMERRIFVRGDKGIAYGRIMEVMGALNEAGFSKVALVAQLPQGGSSGGSSGGAAPKRASGR